jgi:SAM-dependent methyltransferase
MAKRIEELVRRWAISINEELKNLLPRNPNEEEFRHIIDRYLEEFCCEAGINPLAHFEYTLASGRADAVFNRFVIEYKRPGVIRKPRDTATKRAVEQLKGYIQGIFRRERQQLERLAGVVFDGYYIIFIRYVGGNWVVEEPLEVNVDTLTRFLTWLAGLASGIALTSENLNRDFSIEQLRTQNILRNLYLAAAQNIRDENSFVSKLFEQWRLFFSEAIDYSEAFGGGRLENLRKWVRKAGLEIKQAEDAECFFFVLHTYFAFLTKLLAWLALSRHLALRIGAPSFPELVSSEGEVLRRKLGEMESGGIFRAYGIHNLLEGDFFSWYLYAWNPQLEATIKEILRRLDEYDPTTLTLIPEETRDLFKKLYHYLLPREIRHNLGEYYTPDWLAQRLLIQLDNELFATDLSKLKHSQEINLRKKLLNTRFIDPACGSGTFLVLVIARMRELAKALFIPDEQLLETILQNVAGIDLNPLAVLTARVNYLLSIADLLQYRRGDINIPVYLADSVYTPAMSQELFTQEAYQFPTSVGKFFVPASLCQPQIFDRFCSILEDSIKSGLEFNIFLQHLQTYFKDKLQLDEKAIFHLGELYERIYKLHREGMDGLWARLLKNNFAPLTLGEFDYVMGNPPWVNWENLPDQYRQEIMPIWQRYRLFPHGGMDAILGKGKKDISMLMTYTVMDKLLKKGGKLGFIITQSVFKTSGAGQGFRRFSIPQADGKEIPISAQFVDDMVELNPFEGASNRTAVMILKKGEKTRYPVQYTLWKKIRGARFTYDSTLEEVLNSTKRLQFQAEPVNPSDPTSPWLTARPKVLKAIRKVLGQSDYEAHEGVNSGGVNAVYWLDIAMKRPDGLVVVRNLTEWSRREVEEVSEPIEPDLIYPLLRGRDVKRWKANPSAYILMVQDPEKRRGIDEEILQKRYPCTYGYLKRFEEILRQRAAFRRYFTRPGRSGDIIETGPFYSMFDVGNYTFAPWKVVWREQASVMTAAVIGEKDEKPIIPDHKLMLVDFTNPKEAHYVCGLLNSSISQVVCLSYAVEIQMDPHILENIRIPRFDPQNPLHQRLAELSEEAHSAALRDDDKRIREIEGEIDRLAAEIWGLSEEELREIQRNLKELGGMNND